MITFENVSEIFQYKDGHLYWRFSFGRKIKAGARAGWLEKGYVRVAYKGKKYRVHSIVWLMHFGFWPKEIDHINEVKSDNRIENLRISSRAENLLNRSERIKKCKDKFCVLAYFDSYDEALEFVRSQTKK